MEIMEEPCFDFLRTKRQLGYEVDSELHYYYETTYGISITVGSQLDKFTVEDVKINISEFLVEFENHLAQLTSEQFEGKIYTNSSSLSKKNL